MNDIILRGGIPDDSRIANQLIYFTGTYFFDYVFLYDRKRIMDILQYLFEKKNGIFSHTFSTIAEYDQKVAGLELGYSKNQKEFHALLNGIYVITMVGLNKMVKMLYRDYIVHRFIKTLDSNSYYISHLAVVKDYQHQGIGTKLLENSFKKVAKRKLTSCSLDVSIENKNALKLYESMGFKVSREIRDERLERNYGLEGQYRMIKKI